MRKIKLVIFSLLVLVLICQPQSASAITCNDAKRTLKNFDIKIQSLDKKINDYSALINEMQSGILMTTERAKQMKKDCLAFMKGYVNAQSFCDYSKDIGKTTYTCKDVSCQNYLALRLKAQNSVASLKKDRSIVILNSKECFSAKLVLDATKTI
jgi:hypothetical protein